MTGELELRVLAGGEGRKLLLLGDVRTVKVSGAETGGELTIVEQVAAPGAASALHRHPYQEVFYVVDGELEFAGLSNGDPVLVRAGAGATVHAAAGVAHGYRNAGTGPARFLAVMQPAGAEGFFAEVGVWLAEDGLPPPGDVTILSPDEVRAAAARHGIEFLPASWPT
jgi:quercetin dioxygenase-like cupin family protein